MKNFSLKKAASSLLMCCLVGLLTTRNAESQLTAQQAVSQMMRGINIGNSLDAVPTETSWGNPLIQESYFDAYKNAGFNCIRVPITWDAHVSTSSPYTIDATWFTRVEQIVDWGLSRGLFIIINAHHEAWLKSNPSAANIARFQSIWSQIATRFRSKSDHLFFEILNEPNPMSATDVNSINSSILSIIRQTNPTRIVLYSGNNYSNTPELEAAAIPNPNDKYLMGYYHSYDPWAFAGQAQGTWGSASDQAFIKSKFDDIKNWSNSHNIPVIIDEMGAQKNCDYNSRLAYYTCVVNEAMAHNVPFCAWDDNGDFQIYIRSSNNWNAIKDILINTGAPVNYSLLTGTIQAENFVQMSGIQTETTTDAGGGQDVGYIDANDYMIYNVNVPSAGSYTVSYRVASLNGGGILQLEQAGGGVVYGTVNIPSTGGWQNWTTVSHVVTLPAGNQQLAIKANAGGWNINWWGQAQINGSSWSTTIQAESYTQMSGVQLETTSDAGGGQDVGWIDTNDWMVYNPVTIPAAGTYTIQYRVASLNGGGNIQIEQAGGGTIYGSMAVPSTGGWQNWTTIKQYVTLPAGSISFGIKANTGGFNLNWFSITQGQKSAPILNKSSETGTFGLSPNPAVDYILVSNLSEGNHRLEIFNAEGRLMLTMNTREVNTKVSTEGFKSGLYILKVTSENTSKSCKFLIK